LTIFKLGTSNDVQLLFGECHEIGNTHISCIDIKAIEVPKRNMQSLRGLSVKTPEYTLSFGDTAAV
jgi:hypothetical protein